MKLTYYTIVNTTENTLDFIPDEIFYLNPSVTESLDCGLVDTEQLKLKKTYVLPDLEKRLESYGFDMIDQSKFSFFYIYIYIYISFFILRIRNVY